MKSGMIVVGNSGGTNISESFLHAGRELGIESVLLDIAQAYRGNWWQKKIYRHIFNKKPIHLRAFNETVIKTCSDLQPNYLISVGLAPLLQPILLKIKKIGIRILIYLTDDPWNDHQSPPWIFKTLPHFGSIFTPRRANIDDLYSLGCRDVSYLPFGYDPILFYPETDACPVEYDIVFFGGADRDRAAYISALIGHGFKVALYGSYWERFPQTCRHACGQADPALLRHVVGVSRISLCLVRHANRDGHSMRSFEIPAMGGCMLVEDTPEHREIFGADARAVVYFRGISEMVQKARWLCDHSEEQRRLAQCSYSLIVNGRHTYRDRLITILEHARTRGA